MFQSLSQRVECIPIFLRFQQVCIQKSKASVLSKSDDPVWSPGCVSPQVESKDGTVLPIFDPVWSPLIKSARIIQTIAEPKLELSRLTKWSPVIFLALPVLPRKFCSAPLESEFVLPFNYAAQKKRVFESMLVAQPTKEYRCRSMCFVHSKQSHRRKRDREPSRIPKRKFVSLFNHRKKRKQLKRLLKQKVPRSSELHYFCKKSEVTFWIARYSGESCFGQYYLKKNAQKINSNKKGFRNKSIFVRKQCVLPFLSGGMNSTNNQSNQIDAAASSYDRLVDRLLQKGLQPVDVGGCGDCFFRSVSHQYYGSPEFHIEIRQAGVKYLEQHPELFVESVSENSWKVYLQRMRTPGTWCDHIIIQAVANQLHSVIHIIESRLSCPEGSTITPSGGQEITKVLFVGYIEDLHYVSTEPHYTNKNALKYLKFKLSETDAHRKERLAAYRSRYQFTHKRKENKETHGKKKVCVRESLPNATVSKEEYLSNCCTENLAPLHEQPWAKENIANFNKSNNYTIYQCKSCFEAWPLKSTPKSINNYQCARCSREKDLPKKFSTENLMVPSAVPDELRGLTQVEEMLIARALPIMHVYIKPGGQRGFSGHCINIPQDVRELAHSLPRYPKDLPVIVVRKKGIGNNFKNLVVRRQVVSDAIHWLLRNNPLYSDIEINYQALVSLPENEVPQQLLSLQSEEKVIDDTLNCSLDCGPVYEEDDIVYNPNVDTSSFLPVNNSQQQEEHLINQQVFQGHIDWPSSSDNPLNEFTTPFLATLAFPTLFPDSKGDPTNPSLLKNVTLKEKVKHLIKFAEKKDNIWHYRFAYHPRFSYWALNMIQRKTNSSTNWNIF